MEHKGFSLIETLGMCTGRYTKRNPLTPKSIDAIIADMPERTGVVEKNSRPEYGERYAALAKEHNRYPEADRIEKQLDIPDATRQEVVILGSAGMRIVTAGDEQIASGAGRTAAELPADLAPTPSRPSTAGYRRRQGGTGSAGPVARNIPPPAPPRPA